VERHVITKAKAIGKATASGLRLVVVGQGETRGRRPHLVRLREGLVAELREVADGQMYLLVEVALRRFIDELKKRPAGIEVIQVSELEPGPADEHMLGQRLAKVAKKRTAAAKAAGRA
jgi:hypothetical protein